MKSKKSLFGLAIVLVVAVSFVLVQADTSCAKSMTLKISHQFAAGDVRDKMGIVFGEEVTKRTNGEIQFRDYPAQSLYKAREQWDAMRKGGLDMAIYPLDYASGKVPQLSITLMPCTVSNVKQGLSWRNKPIGQKIDALMQANGVRNPV